MAVDYNIIKILKINSSCKGVLLDLGLSLGQDVKV